jgi:hypothetical protein
MLVESKSIKKALESLEPPLGKTTLRILLNELETYGLPLVNDHYEYSFAEIKSSLIKILGDEAAAIILERFKKALAA